LTNHGGAALEHLDAVLDEIQDAMLAPLTAKERKTFVRLLAKLT
jgi:DNA-binding MarR family transcriptional regulator